MGKKKKKIFDQEVGLLETCLESVPSVFIITVMMVSTGENMNTIFGNNLILFLPGNGDGNAPIGARSVGNIIFNPDSTLLTGIFGLHPTRGIAFAEFITTYAISIISAALGLTKILKNGVARPIAPGGPLDGLLSGKFLLAFLASAGVLVARGLCIAATVDPFSPTVTLYFYRIQIIVIYIKYQTGRLSDIAVAIPLLFLPQFLLSLFSTVDLFNKSSLKILYRQPSLIILPTVTFFSFSRLNIGCGSKDSRVSFSKKFTYINIVLSIVGFGSWFVWFHFNIDTGTFFLIFTLPVLVFSILLSIFFLLLDKMPKCCCNPREQLSVYNPDLDKRFIMLDGEVVDDPEDDDDNPKDDGETPEVDVEAGTKIWSGCFNSIVPDSENGDSIEMIRIGDNQNETN